MRSGNLVFRSQVTLAPQEFKMQALSPDLVFTALVSAFLVVAAVASVAALPWHPSELRATEGAVRGAGNWLRVRAVLALAAPARSPARIARVPMAPASRVAA